MELTVINQDSDDDRVEVSDAIFGRAFSEPLVHQVVTAYLHGQRQGTRAQKNRSAVRGGGRKPWRQKGTGRARAGTIRSPLWRSGGRTFPASNQDFSQKVNKKMYRGALCSILSELIREDRLTVVSDLVLEGSKTKGLIAKLKALQIAEEIRILIVMREITDSLRLAARNLQYVKVITTDTLNPADLVRSEKTLLTLDALKLLEERIS